LEAAEAGGKSGKGGSGGELLVVVSSRRKGKIFVGLFADVKTNEPGWGNSVMGEETTLRGERGTEYLPETLKNGAPKKGRAGKRLGVHPGVANISQINGNPLGERGGGNGGKREGFI